MKQQNHFIPLALLTAVVLLAGCTGSDKNYTLAKSEKNPDFKVVEMKTYDDESKFFTFEFNKALWEIEEWEIEKAPNKVALVNKQYPEKNCFILPGTIGLGKEIESVVVEGSFLTTTHVGRTLTITHPAGYETKNVVGYEVDGMPYIFELNLPSKNADTCKQDAQLVIASFEQEDDNQKAGMEEVKDQPAQ